MPTNCWRSGDGGCENRYGNLPPSGDSGYEKPSTDWRQWLRKTSTVWRQWLRSIEGLSVPLYGKLEDSHRNLMQVEYGLSQVSATLTLCFDPFNFWRSSYAA